MDLATGTVVDRYTVHSVLGEGGMAIVYLCRHNQLGTDHALKVLTMSSRAIRERLVQEGKVQASLRHPNIVSVTDILAINGAPGLLMEYIGGPSLDDLIASQNLSYDQVDHLISGILAGVAHAHAQGLVHRDLKPANVMLEVQNGTLVPKVTDFGLAKLLEGDSGRGATRTGSTMGTPHYMSPEQVADSKNVDHRTDVFALGAIMYELVTGQRAFGGENLLQIFASAAAGKFTAPRTLKADLPPRMEAAILGALEPERDKRIQSVEELLAVWEGRSLASGVVPVPPQGPFDAEFISSVKSIHSQAETPSAPDPTWGAANFEGSQVISVETLAQGPKGDQPTPVGAVSGSVVPTSLVRGTTVVLGGGAAFLAGGAGLLFLLLAAGIGYTWFGGVQPTVEAPAETMVALADTRKTAEVSTPAKPAPEERGMAVAPEPQADAAEVPPSPSPVTEEMTDATADVAAPGEEPEPEDPEPEEPAGNEEADPEAVPEDETVEVAAVPSNLDARADLDHEKPGRRFKAIAVLAQDPTVSAKLVEMARTDPSEDVKIRAWQTVGARYRSGVGNTAVEEALLVDALKSGVFSRREAANHYSHRGSDLTLLEPLLWMDYPTIKGAINGIVRIAKRNPSNVPQARSLLEGRLETATNFTKRDLKRALASL